MDRKKNELLNQLNVPLGWLTGPKTKVTISLPESLDTKLEAFCNRESFKKSRIVSIAIEMLFRELGEK